MKKFFLIFKDFFEDFLKNIPRIFLEYFPKNNHKSNKKSRQVWLMLSHLNILMEVLFIENM